MRGYVVDATDLREELLSARTTEVTEVRTPHLLRLQ